MTSKTTGPTLTADQFDTDLRTLNWDTATAAREFDKSETWIRNMRRGDVPLNEEMAAWARKAAQHRLDNPPPKPKAEPWRGGPYSREEVERRAQEAAPAKRKRAKREKAEAA